MSLCRILHYLTANRFVIRKLKSIWDNIRSKWMDSVTSRLHWHDLRNRKNLRAVWKCNWRVLASEWATQPSHNSSNKAH